MTYTVIEKLLEESNLSAGSELDKSSSDSELVEKIVVLHKEQGPLVLYYRIVL